MHRKYDFLFVFGCLIRVISFCANVAIQKKFFKWDQLNNLMIRGLYTVYNSLFMRIKCYTQCIRVYKWFSQFHFISLIYFLDISSIHCLNFWFCWHSNETIFRNYGWFLIGKKLFINKRLILFCFDHLSNSCNFIFELFSSLSENVYAKMYYLPVYLVKMLNSMWALHGKSLDISSHNIKFVGRIQLLFVVFTFIFFSFSFSLCTRCISLHINISLDATRSRIKFWIRTCNLNNGSNNIKNTKFIFRWQTEYL